MSQNSYLVLARKYRPQNFDEVVGQSVLVTTLTNAIKNNKLHHAYILTGIRGVGKTTTARIIAKTINCTNVEMGAQAMACGVCDNCKSIAASRHQDVIEIDAASRTGVDDIREIIDSIAYAPVMARYKIYIIDEVHMLSNSAFNALLKTLEEPPAHVKFIFATTEIRKVPITILSRCQRFDLRRLDEKEIVTHLKNILEKEGFDYDLQGLEMIAQMSEGSVRDALSLTDQALSANNHQKFLASDVVIKMLGLNDRAQVIDLLETLLNGDFGNALNKFHEIYSVSSDILQLIEDLMEITHKTTKTKLVQDYICEGFPDSLQTKIKNIAAKISLSSLARIWQMLIKGNSEINFSSSQKMAFEMLLMRICHLQALPDLKNILLQNNDLPKNILAEKNQQANDDISDDLVGEILRNFEGAKVLE
ncbi:MAG: DNA polymerase III subunit gamma/tau [Rickettsiales bacterium]|nr:DNA polymerase III subunit gamma/tau [Rickettsiales bacterium]